jgi:ABC-type multidrug transport system ATPase subunit
MNEGKLVAAATSTELKNRFGKGFRLNLNLKNCTEESNRCIVELIRSKMEEIELLDNLSGYVISFVAKVSLITELRDLLRFLEDTSLQNEEESALLRNIENLNLSNSSLEEVFMELTSEERQTNQSN